MNERWPFLLEVTRIAKELITAIKQGNVRKFYKSRLWRKKRRDILRRDNYECQRCKAEGRVHVDSKKVEGERKVVELNVHHIKELEDRPDLALDLDNLAIFFI